MTALAILSVASAPDTGRGSIASDGDAEAFAQALTDADVGAATATQPARPTIAITRDNAIRGEDVTPQPEAANTNEPITALPVQPLVAPPTVTVQVAGASAIETETDRSGLTSDSQISVFTEVLENAQASIPGQVLPQTDASQAITVANNETGEAQIVDPSAQTTPPVPAAVQDVAAQDLSAQVATKLALVTPPSTEMPSISGLTLPSVAPREIIDRALRVQVQNEARSTDDQASDADGAPPQAIGEKPVPAQSQFTESLLRSGDETPQPIDVTALTASSGDEPQSTGTATVSTAATSETHAVSAQDLTLSTLARATIETTAQLSAQIVRKLEGRYTRFELALTPEGLGRVDVSLDIDSDGQLAARLAFDNPLAATDLRGRADELRRQLEDAGFRIAQDGLDFAERDPSSGGGFDRRQGQDGNRAFAGATRLAASADAALSAPPRWINLNLTPRGVDMKV